MQINILIIDVGTSSIRGILYDSQGRELFSHQIKYQVHFLGNGMAEQDPRDWSETIVEIGRAVSGYCEEKACQVGAIALTSQRSSIIPVDKEGTPLYHAIMWQDRRNSSIIQELQGQKKYIHSRSGAQLNTVFSGSKMTWLKRNEPEIYQKAYKLCTIADFIVHEITEEYRTDHTYGARSFLMDIRTRQWDPELIGLFEVDQDKLCELMSPGSVVGKVTASFADKTGLPEGIPMISCGGDQQCAALGHGVAGAHSAEVTTGTGAFILGYCEEVPDNLTDNVICGAHAVPGKYVLESSMLCCAAMYNWAKGMLFPNTQGFEEINQAVIDASAGSNGCVVLPYFQGRGTPDWNSAASGSFMNLNLGTSRGDMARAVLESIAYEVKINLDILEAYAGSLDEIYIGGGLTVFPTFNQIQSDVYQKTLKRNRESGEQTALGAWVSAAVTMGLYDSYLAASAVLQSRSSFDVYHPEAQAEEAYQKGLEQMKHYYADLYGGK